MKTYLHHHTRFCKFLRFSLEFYSRIHDRRNAKSVDFRGVMRFANFLCICRHARLLHIPRPMTQGEGNFLIFANTNLNETIVVHLYELELNGHCQTDSENSREKKNRQDNSRDFHIRRSLPLRRQVTGDGEKEKSQGDR